MKYEKKMTCSSIGVLIYCIKYVVVSYVLPFAAKIKEGHTLKSKYCIT